MPSQPVPPVRLTRRSALLSGAALAGLAACGQQGRGSGDPTTVMTVDGRVQGLQAGGVVEFLGLRYANPPTGQRRFQAPEPPVSWSSTELVVDAKA